MAKQTEAQKKTVERVMHEFKHGELKTAAGRKVKNPKQAIAIGLSEAGASNEASPAENKRNLRRTKRNEAAGATGKGERTKAELYALARQRDVPGRSRMSKPELEKAVG